MKKEEIEDILDFYDEHESIKKTAEQFGICFQTVRKILLTFGNYKCPRSQEIRILLDKGKTVSEIAEVLHMSVGHVNSYMPYQKGLYNLDDATVNALRIRKCRGKRK